MKLSSRWRMFESYCEACMGSCRETVLGLLWRAALSSFCSCWGLHSVRGVCKYTEPLAEK